MAVFAVLLVLFLALVAAANVFIAAKNIRALRKIKPGESTGATARITKVTEIKSPKNGKCTFTISHALHYEYSAGGEIREGYFSVPENIPHPKKGDEIKIEYAEEEPGLSIPTQYKKQLKKETGGCIAITALMLFFAAYVAVLLLMR